MDVMQFQATRVACVYGGTAMPCVQDQVQQYAVAVQYCGSWCSERTLSHSLNGEEKMT